VTGGFLVHLWRLNSGQKAPKIELQLFEETKNYTEIAAIL